LLVERVHTYCWHFNGDIDVGYDKSSLSHLLGIDHDDMVLIMEKCGYMDGEKTVDRFQLEMLVNRIGNAPNTRKALGKIMSTVDWISSVTTTGTHHGTNGSNLFA
jgi:hypothetical protein